MVKKVVLVFLFIIPVFVFAQDRIAHVNVNEVFSQMPELKVIETQLAAKGETFSKNIKSMQEEYETKVKDFNNTDPKTSISVLQDKQTEIATLEQRIKDFVEKSQIEFDQERQKLLEPLNAKIRQAIKDVGDENNYVYIFDLSSLLYAGLNSIDATPKVKLKLGITN